MSLKIVVSKESKRRFLQFFISSILALAILSGFVVSAFTVRYYKVSSSASADCTPTVIIDAGHGGFDGGAVVDNINEKDINLKISNSLSAMLKCSGINVICTRTDDSSTEDNSEATISARKKSDMHNRLKLIESNSDAIFVSIHLNKFVSSSAKGAQIFYSPNAENSNLLAESIRSNITTLIQKENYRMLKKGSKDTYLLYYSTIPSVIVECGFMSNPEELKLLLDENYQKQMAFAIYCGILDYLKNE